MKKHEILLNPVGGGGTLGGEAGCQEVKRAGVLQLFLAQCRSAVLCRQLNNMTLPQSTLGEGDFAIVSCKELKKSYNSDIYCHNGGIMRKVALVKNVVQDFKGLLKEKTSPHPCLVAGIKRVSVLCSAKQLCPLPAIRSPKLGEGVESSLPLEGGGLGRGCNVAFTLAEVLITLAIIGVVVAMTMPTLIQNHQKKSLEVATKKFYSMMSQAVKQYMADEGVDDLRNTALASDNYEDTASPEAISSIRNFVTKYLKVVKECDHNANDCFAQQYKLWNGQIIDYNIFNSYSVYTNFIVLSDGAVIALGYNLTGSPIRILVDVNGKKGPNRAGYDLWDMDIFYDGVIDSAHINPECRKGSNICGDYENSPQEAREWQYLDKCQGELNGEGTYGACFGHFLNNGFKFDY